MNFRPFILAIFLLFSVQTRVFAHPHVFIHNSVTIVFDENGLAGFKVDWVFDEMFSNMIIHDYDQNKNKKFRERGIFQFKKI